MFGAKPGGFGAPAATPAFGAPAPQPQATAFGGFGAAQPAASTAFGAAAPTTGAFGAAQPAAGGGLFGATAQQPQQPAAGGLFGTPAATATTASTFGGFGATPAATSTAFGAGSTFGRPATTGAFGGFGATAQPAASTAGGLFGTPASTTTAFGATPAAQPGAFGGFGAAAAGQQQSGTVIKFNPHCGTDTMMKSGVTTNINTRHQCITCMKEYEQKSLEELRCEDYMANRKGGAAAGVAPAAGAGGLFGAPPNQTAAAPAAGGGFFGAQTPASTQSSLFGQQQQKPMFGAATTGGFGAAASTAPAFGSTTGAFGATSTAGQTGGGLFGKPATTGFGAPAASTAAGFGGFGAPATSTTGGGLFGSTQAKPIGFGTTTTQAGGLFGSTTTTGFGAQPAQQPAFGAAQPAAGGFGAQQPAQAGGLFGAAAKPGGFGAATTGFGTPASGAATAGFGGFGATAATSQPSAFGAAAGAAKPAFGGFGTTTTSTAGGFGGFGATAQPAAAGGMFGQQKPTSLSFGTSTLGTGATANPGFGGFGATSTAGTTGGGLFGATQQKPGGMFGATTGGFGATTGGFGAGTTTGGFGATGGLGASTTGGMFGGGFGQPAAGGLGAAAAGQAAPNAGAGANPIQQQLLQLASSPYGDSPLYKNLLQESGKRDEILKPVNPSAQKALDATNNVYKVSPHRNMRAKAKPLSGAAGANQSANKSAIFDGLEDNDDLNKSDVFVPRTSVKKLVLKPKSPKVSTSTPAAAPKDAAGAAAESTPLPQAQKPPQQQKKGLVIPAPPDLELTADETSAAANDASLNASNANNTSGSGKKISGAAGGSIDQPEESFRIQRKALCNPDTTTVGEDSFAAQNPSSCSDEVSDDDEENNNPAGVRLRRSGYYTIPLLSEIGSLVDQANGTCLVENFTVGRTGYGNIFFPGLTDVMNMNLDEIVFFRHKEVIVYPNDAKKPPLGQGLNKKAQVTLDRVWPVDKTTKSTIKSPERLEAMNYEERLQKACLKLDARFVEFRPETGSWVFKVDHFSKYGLDDSDDEDVENAGANVAKKTAAGAKPGVKVLTTTKATVHKEPVSSSADLIAREVERQSAMEQDGGSGGPLQAKKAPALNPKVQMMKTLFDDDDNDEQLQMGLGRPVILEQRPTALQRRDPLAEDIARSLIGGPSKGLGGSFVGGDSSPMMMPQSATSNLLRTRFLTQHNTAASASESAAPAVLDSSSMLGTPGPKSRLPTYSLQAGYDKFVSLPATGAGERAQCVVPRHGDHLRPLEESLFRGRLTLLADSGLSQGRRFRPGWAGNWQLAHCGAPFDPLAGGSRTALVHLERLETSSFGRVTDEQVVSIEHWLQVALDNAEVTLEGRSDDPDNRTPKFSVKPSVDTLHAYAEEAKGQLARQDSLEEAFGRGLIEQKRIWELCLALWGRLREGEIFEYGMDSHETTMLRREAVSDWLSDAVSSDAKADLDTALVKGDHLDEILALLSGNRLEEACERAQAAGDHYLALLLATAEGPNSVGGQMVLQQLDRWQELRADAHVDARRLRLLALLAGAPVWHGSDGRSVNVCAGLDWKRSLALHFWFLSSPVASVGDAFAAYEAAFDPPGEQGDAEPYAHCPNPEYDDLELEARDVKFHLLKLYTKRSHALEQLLCPSTHTADALDHRLSWFLGQALQAVGHAHLRPDRRDALHMSFSAQLESFGLWHWAVLPLLHLDDPGHRRAEVLRLLGRHVRLSDDESAEREAFLMDALRVPMAWIAEAKAIRAGAERSPRDQAWYLAKAGQAQRAHDVTVKEIAPAAIIDEDYEFLHAILKDLADSKDAILDWETKGGCYLDFMDVELEVKALLARRDDPAVDLDYHLEALRPRVASLCSAVASLPAGCARERLCQSEIAKRAAGLARAIAPGGGDARSLAEQLSKLPMPEDYALQELRTLTRNYMVEIMEES